MKPRTIFVFLALCALAGCQAFGAEPKPQTADQAVLNPPVKTAVFEAPADQGVSTPFDQKAVRLVSDTQPRYPLAVGVINGVRQRVPNPFPRFTTSTPRVICSTPTLAPAPEQTIVVNCQPPEKPAEAKTAEKTPEKSEDTADSTLANVVAFVIAAGAVFAIKAKASIFG